jgi:ABC-type multidrug transport system ATPase subunit
MNESMLNSLMRLFAIMAGINREAVHVLARNFVESYLSQQVSSGLAQKFLGIFDEYSAELFAADQSTKGKKISALSVKILGICNQIVDELHLRHRFQILLSLIRFAKYFEDVSSGTTGFENAITDAVRTVADGLQIRPEEYANCSAFITDKFYKVPDKRKLLVVSDDPDFAFTEIRHLQKNGLGGQLFVLRILRADIYLFQYAGKERLELKNRYIFPHHVYLFPRGGAIRGEKISPIYYSDIVSGFLRDAGTEQVDLLARNVEFRFRNSHNGIHTFSFQGRSGQMVGIMGGSGTGKSTLMRVLNGSLKLTSGTIYINGHDLYREKKELEGMIGYIPQDDLLLEELTVYQNLMFNARLCLDSHTGEQLNNIVDNLLHELDLYEARELKVGTPLNKFISGGQRKRLNIALELIREPSMLFVDEPTSGLSSTDSENVMLLLKEQAMKGKLVVVNIHQPSSDLFKLFDHLIVMDKGGYPVYSGNPVEGIIYFKQLAERVDAGESECAACGNTNPEEILQIMEDRDVDEYGEFTQHRKTSPAEWYRHYLEKIQSKMEFSLVKTPVPENKFRIPGGLKQFAIFFSRNLLSKIADRQFMAISLVVAPILAVILGYFTKYVSGDGQDPHAYLFSMNENLPAYIFMSVIVALFLGLIISAEEIIKDRRILERESFLHLSRTAYLLSKMSFLFLLSAFQMFLFVVIGNSILEIRDMTLTYWLILFVTACFANMLGLNISDGLKSVVAIYIVVPFLLVPQILLAGVIVKWDKLHYTFASAEAVPVIGDIMASRWAYEALSVAQFVNNNYQKNLYRVEMRQSNVAYDRQFLVPALIQEIRDARELFTREPADPGLPARLETIRDAFGSIFLTGKFAGTGRFNPVDFSTALADSATEWLGDYRSRLSTSTEELDRERDGIFADLREEKGGKAGLLEFKRNYYNESLADLLLNRIDLYRIVKINGKLVRKMEPVYMYPLMKNGRAQFFASVKRIGNLYVSTVMFNVMALLLMCIVFYLTLQFGILRKTLDLFGGKKRRKSSSSVAAATVGG